MISDEKRLAGKTFERNSFYKFQFQIQEIQLNVEKEILKIKLFHLILKKCSK